MKFLLPLHNSGLVMEEQSEEKGLIGGHNLKLTPFVAKVFRNIN